MQVAGKGECKNCRTLRQSGVSSSLESLSKQRRWRRWGRAREGEFHFCVWIVVELREEVKKYRERMAAVECTKKEEKIIDPMCYRFNFQTKIFTFRLSIYINRRGKINYQNYDAFFMPVVSERGNEKNVILPNRIPLNWNLCCFFILLSQLKTSMLT